jgi:putative tryptophan/tyrosine transport system substrate-binding protein
MRRREFIAGLGAAGAWPLAARAQQPEHMRLVGLLMGIAEASPEGRAWVAALQQGLGALGWTKERNIRFDVRWASANVQIMRAQAAELVNMKCELVVTHATPATLALREVTRTVPNVFVVVTEPVSSGIVQSIARPGGNSTGFTNFEPGIGTKWLQLLTEIAPKTRRIVLMVNPETAPGGGAAYINSVEATSPSFGVASLVKSFRNDAEIEEIFSTLGQDQTDGLIVLPDTSTTTYSTLISVLALRRRVPAIYPYRDFIVSGGLLSYGVDREDLYRRAASYVDRVLKGEKPADLPVQAPTKFELVINLKTAKSLGLAIPETLLATADEVIQ